MVVRASATLLILAGVALIRFSSSLRASLGTSALGRILFLFYDSENVYLRKLPEDFTIALCIIAVGWALLLVRPSPGTPPDSASLRPRAFRRWDGVVIFFFPFLSLALFLLFSRRNLIQSPLALVVFLVMAALPTFLVCRMDRREGVRLGFSMSRREKWGLAAGTLATLALYSRGLNSWKYSFIGDEWAFDVMASSLASRRLIEIPWLSAHGVYEQWPAGVSAWQSLWIRLLPPPVNVSWRFSNVVLLALCLAPLYLTLRHLLGRVAPAPGFAAAVGCSFFGLSEFIIGWARIGEPNAVFIPPLVFAGCFFLAGLERRSRAHFFLAGVTCGLGCFLSSLSAAIPMIILPFWLLVDVMTSSREGRRFVRDVFIPVGYLGAGFLIVAAPLFMQLSYWQELIKVNVSSGEAAENRHLWLAKTFQATFAFLDYRTKNHFMFRNVIDPVTAFWTAAGLGMARWVGARRFGLLVVTLVGTALLCGGISQYETPPITRMLVILYPVSMLAAVGFAGLTSGSRRLRVALAAVVIPVCAAYNPLKLESWNPYKLNQEYYLLEMRRIEESPPQLLHALVVPKAQRYFFSELLPAAYGYADRVASFDDDADGYAKLAQFLETHRGQPVEVRTRGDAARIRALAEATGARFGPPIEDGVPPLTDERDRRIFPFFEAMNP